MIQERRTTSTKRPPLDSGLGEEITVLVEKGNVGSELVGKELGNDDIESEEFRIVVERFRKTVCSERVFLGF